VKIYSKGISTINDIVLMVNDKNSDFIIIELKGDFDSKMLSEVEKKSYNVSFKIKLKDGIGGIFMY
jgi:Ulp1 family protease